MRVAAPISSDPDRYRWQTYQKTCCTCCLDPSAECEDHGRDVYLSACNTQQARHEADAKPKDESRDYPAMRPCPEGMARSGRTKVNANESQGMLKS
jgi:hypothetical protein